MRTKTQISGSILAAALILSTGPGTARAGTMDALLGDWDLNIGKSKFKPSPPMKKYDCEADQGEDKVGMTYHNDLIFERP